MKLFRFFIETREDSAKSRLSFPKKHSTRCRSLYRCQSYSQVSLRLRLGGMTTVAPWACTWSS